MFSFFWNIYLGQSPRTEISGSKVWTYYQAVFCFVPPPPSQAYAYLTATLSETVVFSPHYRSRISAQKLHVTNVYNLASLDIHILSCYYDHNPGNRPSLHLQGFQVKFLCCWSSSCKITPAFKRQVKQLAKSATLFHALLHQQHRLFRNFLQVI